MPRQHIIILLGPPGSGKGTVSPAIVEELNIPQLSTGDMLRQAVSEGSDVGKKAKSIMAVGGLVSDDIVFGIIKDRIQMEDCKNGFLFDGFPRTVPQAEGLDELLKTTDDKVTMVIELKVPDEVLIERICGRWIHQPSGRSYHVKNKPPKSYEGKDPKVEAPNGTNMLDDETGEALIQRADDNENSLKDRLKNYHEQTVPILKKYKRVVKRLNGDQEMEKVVEEVKQAISTPTIPPQAISTPTIPPQAISTPTLAARADSKKSSGGVTGGLCACFGGKKAAMDATGGNTV